MIALDTNVLVRLVLQDDPDQARAAERLVVAARRAGEELFIADVVLCELVWVLTVRARMPRADIADALEQIVRTELLVFADTGIVERSVVAYRAGKGDFADYLIREQALVRDAREIVTFDRALAGERGFRLLAGRQRG